MFPENNCFIKNHKCIDLILPYLKKKLQLLTLNANISFRENVKSYFVEATVRIFGTIPIVVDTNIQIVDITICIVVKVIKKNNQFLFLGWRRDHYSLIPQFVNTTIMIVDTIINIVVKRFKISHLNSVLRILISLLLRLT